MTTALAFLPSRDTVRQRGHVYALGAVVVVLATLALLAWLLPELVYYPIVWRYYFGPVVTDAAGGPITLGGVTAYPGYNPVDTVTYGIVLAVSLWNVLAFLRRRGIELGRQLVYALLPMIAFGGTLRGLVEIDWVPTPWAFAFITPYIYFVVFFYTLAALVLGVAIERRTQGRWTHVRVVLLAGLLAWGVTLAGWASFILAPPNGVVRWVVLFEIFGYAAFLTGAIVVGLWGPGFKFVRDPLYVLVLYGQIVDGMQNYIGITRGYASKLMGPNFLAAVFGDLGLLIGKVALMVPLLAYLKAKVEPDEHTSRNQLMLILLAMLALGLAMGFHGGVPMLLGL